MQIHSLNGYNSQDSGISSASLMWVQEPKPQGHLALNLNLHSVEIDLEENIQVLSQWSYRLMASSAKTSSFLSHTSFFLKTRYFVISVLWLALGVETNSQYLSFLLNNSPLSQRFWHKGQEVCLRTHLSAGLDRCSLIYGFLEALPSWIFLFYLHHPLESSQALSKYLI